MPMYFAAAASLIGTAMSVAGTVQSANAQRAAAAYQAQVAANNAKAAQQAAAYTKQAGQAEEQTVELKNAQLTGSQFAAQAANGIDVNTGSAQQVRQSTAITGTYDALTVRNNAENAALGIEEQGVNYSAQAGLDRSAGVNAMAAGGANAFSSALGGASSLASKWSALQQQTGSAMPATSIGVSDPSDAF